MTAEERLIRAVEEGVGDGDRERAFCELPEGSNPAYRLYFDSNIGLVLQNYLEYRSAFLGAPGYTEERFRGMEVIVPTLGPLFSRALGAGLRMPLGSDAVAGAHGRNAREIVARVRAGGQRPADAIVGATSLAAESLGLGDTIGTLSPGRQADVIVVRGDPLRDIRSVEQVLFVMKGGRVYRADATTGARGR